MSIKRKAITSLALAIAFTGIGAAGAPSAMASIEEASSIVVDGQELGPEDGLSVVTESYPVVAGEQTGETYDSELARDVWGSSYAFSQEQAYVSYIGHAKAAANVYEGLRIVRVCFWWTQAERTSVTTCADATFSGGSWYASGEVTGSFNDSLDTYAPQTIFNIQTSRIDPRG